MLRWLLCVAFRVVLTVGFSHFTLAVPYSRQVRIVWMVMHGGDCTTRSQARAALGLVFDLAVLIMPAVMFAESTRFCKVYERG